MNNVTVATLHDGPRNLVMQITGEGDTLGQESFVIKVPTKAKITKLTSDVSNGTVRLYWDALDPVLFASLAGQQEFLYEKTGGYVNPTDSTDILLSTGGFSEGSVYTIKLEMVKK